MNDYDANGKKIGHSSPSFFGGMNHYDLDRKRGIDIFTGLP